MLPRPHRSLVCLPFLALAIAVIARPGYAAEPSTPTVPMSPSPLFQPENLLAWCIVPFDQRLRRPAERIAMLERLGITQYAWDWRDVHLPDLPEELRLAREHGIKLRAIWLWIDGTTDRVGELNAGNRAVLEAVRTAGQPVEFWLGMHANVFAALPDDEARVRHGAALIAYVRDQAAAAAGSTIALYNHGDWFGETENELRLIAAVGDPTIGLVFNFHHAHAMIEAFPRLLPRMLPHLRAVNLNGMRPEGPKILPIGAGTHEAAMIRLLIHSGYRGPIGVLGHVEDADVEDVLRRNLAGLRELVASSDRVP